MSFFRLAWSGSLLVMLAWISVCPADETPLFTFMQFSDVHVGAAVNEPVHARLNAAVVLANALQPAFVIDSGDMTNDPVYAASPENLAQFDEYQSYVAPLTMPIYQLPGNHDIGYPDYVGTVYEEDDEALVAAYEDKIGPLNQSFTHQGYRFILFNNNPLLSGQPGHISEATFTWLESELAQGEKAFLFCHIPVLENGTGPPWGASAERLTALCEEYDVAAVGYGHIHTSKVKSLNSIHYITCPDLKVAGHQSVNQYQVFDDHFELRQFDIVSQQSTLIGSYAYEQEEIEPVKPASPDWAWNFDDGSGATTATAAFGSVDGQIVGAASTTNTPLSYAGNHALDFDGTNDRVDLDGINLSSDNNHAVTLSAWVYSENSTGIKPQIFGNWFQGGDKQTVALFDYFGGARVVAEIVGGTCGTTSGEGTFPRGEWVHLAVVYDGSASDDGFAGVYVNGTLATSIHDAGALRNIANEGIYAIGGDSGATDRYFGGLIDEVAVWRSALTAENIKWLYENSMTTLSESLEGDLNGDGFVGGDDLDIVRSFWGQNVTAGDLLSGDPSNDGFVGGDDLDIVRANWGQGTPPSPTAVPEPSTLISLLALASFAVYRAVRSP